MTDKNDDILRKLMKETETFGAPAGFTQQVMQKIKLEESAADDYDISWILSPRYWVMIGLGLGIAVAFIFSYDLPFITNIFELLEPSNLGNFSGTFIQSYQAFLRDFQFSSSALIIIISVVALFLIDRILRKGFNHGFFSN